jgi:hypothetical protein
LYRILTWFEEFLEYNHLHIVITFMFLQYEHILMIIQQQLTASGSLGIFVEEI